MEKTKVMTGNVKEVTTNIKDLRDIFGDITIEELINKLNTHKNGT